MSQANDETIVDEKGPEEGGNDVKDAREWETRDSVYYDSKQENVLENEDEEAYRLRVYETTKDDFSGEASRKTTQGNNQGSFSKRLSRQLSRRRSSIVDSLPETPAGWTVLVSALLSTVLGYEVRLQKSLTQPPITLGQLPKGSHMASIHAKLTATAGSILSRPIQPSLFVGTRGVIASTAAFLFGGPSPVEEHLQFREIVTSSQDGARIGVDWEVPWRTNDSTISTMSREEREEEILKGPIRQPVVIILHGINNDSSFGYMRSLQRTFANRGWNAAAMNFRGCGGVPLATPRSYNACYTGDLRNLVLQISARLDENVPLFLVGNSLGANLMAKYLGEEGLSGTLPACVAGAVSLGNPMLFHADHIAFPYNVLIGSARKQAYMEHWRAFRKMRDPAFQKSLRKGLFTTTLAGLDHALAPTMVRNDAFYPHSSRIGYKTGLSYWRDSGSYRLVPFISVPFLHLTAEDDFLVYGSSKNKLGFCVANPNVMVVETRCGGHLGWQESPPDAESIFSLSSSWADVASADFFDAVMQVNSEDIGSPVGSTRTLDGDFFDLENLKEDAVRSTQQLRSRL